MANKSSLSLAIVLLISFTTISAQVPSNAPLNGLVGWWSFNGNAVDESGNGNNGISLGATLTTDRQNQSNSAYFFDGLSEVQCTSDSTLILNEFSVSAWVYLSSTAQGTYQTIISKYDVYSYGSFSLSMYGDKADIWFTIDSTSHIEITSTGSLLTNQWYLITVTHSLTTGTNIYINGLLNHTDNTIFNVLQAPNDNIRFGSQGSFSPVRLQNGKIDDIGIWNRVLTSTEVLNLFTSPVGITNIPDSQNIEVFPNPSSTQINIKVNEDLIGTTYNMYNSIGKIVQVGIITSNNTAIDISHISSGVYSLSFSGIQKTNRIVVIN